MNIRGKKLFLITICLGIILVYSEIRNTTESEYRDRREAREAEMLVKLAEEETKRLKLLARIYGLSEEEISVALEEKSVTDGLEKVK